MANFVNSEYQKKRCRKKHQTVFNCIKIHQGTRFKKAQGKASPNIYCRSQCKNEKNKIYPIASIPFSRTMPDHDEFLILFGHEWYVPFGYEDLP
jgi:hypothetical protein